MTSKPGIYPNIPENEYFEIDALSNTFMCQFERAPANAIWYKKAPEEARSSDSVMLGSIVHCLALEPETFNKKYIVQPEIDRRTKEGKAAHAHFIANLNNGHEAVPEKMKAKADMIVQSMLAHPEFNKALTHKSAKPECVVIWDNEEGLRCKARVDLLIDLGNEAFVLDLKTTADLDKIQWKINDYGYDRQQAMYSEGLRANGFETVHFFFGFVSTVPVLNRYPCRFVMLSDERLQQAELAHINRMEAYKACLDSNEWNGVEII